MNTQYISPLSELKAEVEPLFSNDNMLAFFKKFCEAIQSHAEGFKKAKNAKYDVEDFLRVFFYSEITGRSVDSASERLNRYFMGNKRGKTKTYADGRKERVVPHQTQVNDLLREVGLEEAREILRTCMSCQLTEALELGIISKKVNVLIDFTEHDYYGSRNDPMIKGTIKGDGTNKMRHYLGFSICSRDHHLFAGLEHVAKGQSKVPVILDFLEHLIELGFELRYVMMDREFYEAQLMKEIKGVKGDVLIPAKSYRRVNTMIEEYLTGEGERIRKYNISSAPGSQMVHSQDLYLILRAKKGHSLLDVKRDFRSGKLDLDEARKLIYAIMTTERPKGQTSSWASRTSKLYKRRWFIETGFSDLNRMGPRWKSKNDNSRYLDMLVRMLLYNSWKMNRAYLEKCQKMHEGESRWTLRDNQDSLCELFLSAQKTAVGAL